MVTARARMMRFLSADGGGFDFQSRQKSSSETIPTRSSVTRNDSMAAGLTPRMPNAQAVMVGTPSLFSREIARYSLAEPITGRLNWIRFFQISPQPTGPWSLMK